ncbi:ABC transporter permease [Ruminococcaceae bacterium OttesenSCG-928-O06]|nr:ABC transporter permease [Ruminococcaceae bacterium OttesenSCG-928-O06]
MTSVTALYAKLRKKGFKNYVLITVCIFISILLITAFSIVMQSNTVQTVLPEGGDSRKQVTMIFSLAIAGCAMFTAYASTLFFRSKSRELGIFMALGTKKSTVARLLFGDLGLVTLVAAAAGIVLGTPMAIGIWQVFRLIVASSEMAFSLNAAAYLWPLGFALFTGLLLLVMGLRFVRRSNILDVVNEQRKSDPVKDVKGWYGIVGIAMMVLGAGGAVVLPRVMASHGYTPQAWTNLFYLLAAAGLYMLLLFVVVRGFGGKKSHYKNIITRSMMKFQGRQTVLNMCVIAVLVMAAYYAMFYTPMTLSSSNTAFASRHTDFAFHYRAGETGIPGRDSIEAIAREEGQAVSDYLEVDMANLATDGIDREWTDDGRFGDTYIEFYQEESFFSESAYNQLTGGNVDVQPGHYVFVSREGYSHNPYDYIKDMKRFTNPTTMECLPVAFQAEVSNNLLHRFILLDDTDYTQITQGLDSGWKEKWVQFDVSDPENSYTFAARLKDAIIDGSSENAAIINNYDRVEKMNAEAAGEAYEGDVVPEMQISYDMRDSGVFNTDWRYIPKFRIMDSQNLVFNIAVYLMLFIFMCIICFAAVIVIAYARCLTIALQNQQVYSDLYRLGAKRDYLYRSVRGQVARVFAVPTLVGTLIISAYYALLMYSNSGSFSPGEIQAFGVIALLIAGTSLLLWVVYRITLRKTTRMLGVDLKGVST